MMSYITETKNLSKKIFLLFVPRTIHVHGGNSMPLKSLLKEILGIKSPSKEQHFIFREYCELTPDDSPFPVLCDKKIIGTEYCRSECPWRKFYNDSHQEVTLT